MTRVLAAAVTFERPGMLDSTLQRVRMQSRPPDAILVVDNGAVLLAGEVALANGADYVRTGQNLGPAGGFVLGMMTLLQRAQPGDWIYLIDDDDPPAHQREIEMLLAFADEAIARGHRVGCVGKVGGRLDRFGRLQKVPDTELNGIVEVDYIGSGQSPLYSAEALTQCNLDVDGMFFGFEDLEFGLAVRKAGYKLLVPGDEWLARRQRKATGRASVSPAWRRYYGTRNLVSIVRARQGVLPAAVASLYGIGGAVVASIKQQSPENTVLGFRAVLDAWTGVKGKTVKPAVKSQQR